MLPLLIISGYYDVISKKFKKSKISRFPVSGCFFLNKNMLIVISSKNATEWCVTWLVFEYDLKNALFDHSLEIWFATSGLNICWSQNKYFWNQCKKCFNLRCHLDHLSLIFLFNIRTVRIGKMFLVVSRDSLTDKQNKIYWALRNSTWSDKSHFKLNLGQKSGNGVGIANLDLLSISWPSYSFLWKTNLFSCPF